MRKHLSEPWFSLVCAGKKRFEGRLAGNADFAAARVGSVITWYNADLPFERTCRCKVTGKRSYPSFRAMLEDRGVDRVLPTVPTAKQGALVYRRFYPEADERREGVLCLRIKVVT